MLFLGELLVDEAEALDFVECLLDGTLSLLKRESFQIELLVEAGAFHQTCAAHVVDNRFDLLV